MICPHCQKERSDVVFKTVCEHCKIPYDTSRISKKYLIKLKRDAGLLAKKSNFALAIDRLGWKIQSIWNTVGRLRPKTKLVPIYHHSPASGLNQNIGKWEVLLVMGLVIFLIRCQANNSGINKIFPASEETKELAYIAIQQGFIKAKLKDPDSARFSNTFVSKISGVPVVCGLVSARNGFGGYSEPQLFVSSGSIHVLAGDISSSEMYDLVSKVCAADN